MRLFNLFILLALFCCNHSFSQQKKTEGWRLPLDSLNDDFSESSSFDSWQQWHTTAGQPNKWRIAKMNNGLLHLEPYASGWYADYQAPFFFKTVEGDFDVRTRIKVSGQKDSLPQTDWSAAGLMVRQPVQHGAVWEPRKENWLFINSGIAIPLGSPIIEAKSTNNSVSNLKLRPSKAGWIELRIVRVMASFILMCRYEGEDWTVVERLYRPLLPSVLQVGINAYSGWNAMPKDVQADPVMHNKAVLKEVPIDMQVQVDYVHFTRPKLNATKLNSLAKPGFRAPYYLPANLLTDYSVSNADVLQIIDGDK